MKGFVESGNPLYQRWIEENVHGDPRGQCTPMAKALANNFPELRVVGSCDPFFGYGHTWCLEPDGKVVDPTSHQFVGVPYEYPTDFLELKDFPRGKCMWCGEIMFPDTPRVREYLGGCDIIIGPHVECNKRLMEEMG